MLKKQHPKLSISLEKLCTQGKEEWDGWREKNLLAEIGKKGPKEKEKNKAPDQDRATKRELDGAKSLDLKKGGGKEGP